MEGDIEVTLEANPGAIETGKMAAFKAAGVNRLSIGIQAFDDKLLKYLGRHHDLKDALAALEMAAKYFDRYSFDMICARPDQPLSAWRDELKEALKYARGHISLYQLTIEAGTAFHTRQRLGEKMTPDEVLAEALFVETREILANADLPAYEISNHAHLGQESQHNLAYWRYQNYIGIGPGAHGRRLGLSSAGQVQTQAVEKIRLPEKWLTSMEDIGSAYSDLQTLTSDIQAREAVMMGLRLNEGLSQRHLIARTGQNFSDIFGHGDVQAMNQHFNPLIEAGYLTHSHKNTDNQIICLTERGFLLLDGVLSHLIG
jgi:oxygen-independent coproporphyrinogen-3 oxidase